METSIVYWGYVGTMAKKTETTIDSAENFGKVFATVEPV